ncbi:hypothetical protein [Sulfurospirillum barnesii]|uniref:Uncharacterized protein n=1 Tax=Sulfurospirillum barnesii (strain ATCC 700032 / DSM 10660 / SES-3) TaxID=760154 RepID=I3Y0C3_SULBS|nr:hypothetical protein [Sulfurospirillum barnesii]AFL69647.1 hypothetical protein Sulba_2379 [Sulfurospirillum barnesii SES-3]
MLDILKIEQWEKYVRSILDKPTFSDWIQIIGVIVAAIGVIIACIQIFDSSKVKQEINSTLIEFQSNLQQIKYVREKYHPENVYLRTRDGIVDAVDKLNAHHKEMHEPVKFEKIYQLIKDYGTKKTNDRLSEVSILVKDKTMAVTLYVASIKPDEISGQKEFDKINNKYISLVNEVSSAYAEYHGFIQGLTLKDFEY